VEVGERGSLGADMVEVERWRLAEFVLVFILVFFGGRFGQQCLDPEILGIDMLFLVGFDLERREGFGVFTCSWMNAIGQARTKLEH